MTGRKNATKKKRVRFASLATFAILLDRLAKRGLSARPELSTVPEKRDTDRLRQMYPQFSVKGERGYMTDDVLAAADSETQMADARKRRLSAGSAIDTAYLFADKAQELRSAPLAVARHQRLGLIDMTARELMRLLSMPGSEGKLGDVTDLVLLRRTLHRVAQRATKVSLRLDKGGPDRLSVNAPASELPPPRELLMDGLKKSAKDIILSRAGGIKASDFSVFAQVVTDMAGDPMNAENIRNASKPRSKPRGQKPRQN